MAQARSSAAGDPGRRSAVKTNLTSDRAVENYENAAFIRRVLRAYGRRIATATWTPWSTSGQPRPPELDQAISQAVTRLHIAGFSWAE